MVRSILSCPPDLSAMSRSEFAPGASNQLTIFSIGMKGKCFYSRATQLHNYDLLWTSNSYTHLLKMNLCSLFNCRSFYHLPLSQCLCHGWIQVIPSYTSWRSKIVPVLSGSDILPSEDAMQNANEQSRVITYVTYRPCLGLKVSWNWLKDWKENRYISFFVGWVDASSCLSSFYNRNCLNGNWIAKSFTFAIWDMVELRAPVCLQELTNNARHKDVCFDTLRFAKLNHGIVRFRGLSYVNRSRHHLWSVIKPVPWNRMEPFVSSGHHTDPILYPIMLHL